MRTRLTKDQNLALQGLDLEEKLTLLQQWKKEGAISNEAFNYFSNRWINKESKKLLNAAETSSEAKQQNSRCRSIIEGEIQFFLDKLHKNMNTYLASRHEEDARLSDADFAKMQKYLQNCFSYRNLINKLIILGLRYPDKRVNKLCEEFITKNRKHSHYQDFAFWQLLWEDKKFVPLDAVRLMLTEENGRYVIDQCFDSFLIQKLIPAIRFQRDKEKRRLKWAETLEGTNRTREVARKQSRLEAFEMLLNAAANYIH